MINYKFKNLKIGKKKKFKIKITKKLLEQFKNLSKDNNPLHSNKIFAKKYKFKDKVVHGMLVGAIFSRFIGTILPGKYAVILEIKIKFNNPLYINDTLSIEGKVINLSESYKIATIEITAKNQFNKKISYSESIVKLNE